MSNIEFSDYCGSLTDENLMSHLGYIVAELLERKSLQ